MPVMTDERTPAQVVEAAHPNQWQKLVHRFATIGSTMDAARTLVADGAPHGSVVLAEQQAAGRGRGGRVWASPPGNLHATFILRPGGSPQHAPQLAFVVAVAVARAVDALAGPPTALKWPNDVMRDGAKLAGILLERLDDDAVLAGIGMNVRHHPPGMPYPVTSLAALGCDTTPESVLAAIQRALQGEWTIWRDHGFARVRERWLERGPAIGTILRVQLGPDTIDGAFAGLRDDGALLLQTPTGRRAIVAGDVQLIVAGDVQPIVARDVQPIVAGDVQPCATPPDVAKTSAC
jgi:BirA family biotin operon repressor/biotin-[acetyl-CoA-carboxylase] ligase